MQRSRPESPEHRGGDGRRGEPVILIEVRHWRYALYRGYLNLRAEASKYHFGWLWWFLEPILMTAVFAVVFTFIRPRGVDFVYFLVVGVTVWLWFSNAVGNATQSLVTARSLIVQTRLPKILFPLIAVIGSSYKQFFVFCVLFAVLALTAGISWPWLALPVVALTQLCLIVAAATSAAFLCAWFPDFRFFVVSGLQLMMFCSGIFFDISEFPEGAQQWFRANPMAVMIEQYRAILLEGQWPQFAWCAALSFAAVLWIAVVDRLQRHFDQAITLRVIS